MVNEVLVVFALIAFPQGLGCAEMEAFLMTAKVGAQRDLPVGITVPKRATLTDGTRTHDA